VLKISRLKSLKHAVVLRLEGRVVGPWVTELQKACAEARTESRPLRLHLADVEFMDASGVALLSQLCSQGVDFLECPPFAAEQLKAANGSYEPP
jgi:anti-anti-sigma regulatory factor